MILTALLAVCCGVLVGFTLGLIGGGGSILATPLLLYVVGMQEPHLAIGTGAVAVSANAFMNLTGHARAGNVRWSTAAIFAAAGVLGALVGSTLGKAFDGQRLLILFALLMIVIGALMLRPRRDGSHAPAALTLSYVLRTAGTGLGVGVLSGFFGIGGGFLIVPGLIFATGMPMIYAIGTSLFAVGMFGLTTALNYAMSGLVDWVVAAEYIAGGVVGGMLGMRAAVHLSGRKQTLTRIFACIVFIVALYMLWRSLRHT
ncbi:MAG TPA: hypothetical protein DDZ81_01115 [Acetobacteraceae bacterium]|jgi:uncharacterized protein|nr:hypothetical protein [Acetobacteraceae bacterium]